MATLQRLPEELLFQIYTHLSHIRDAVRLSSTCRSLFKAWASNSNHIGHALLPRSFLAGRNAHTLALIDVTKTMAKPVYQEGTVERLFRRMIENDAMCRQVIALRRTHVQEHNDWMIEHHGWAYDSSVEEVRVLDTEEGMQRQMDGYYIARQLARAHQLVKIQPNVLENVLRHREQRSNHWGFLLWMLYTMKGRKLRTWHGMKAQGSRWEPTVDPREPVQVEQPPCWEFAQETLDRGYYGPRKELPGLCDGEGGCHCPPREESSV